MRKSRALVDESMNHGLPSRMVILGLAEGNDIECTTRMTNEGVNVEKRLSEKDEQRGSS